MSMTNDLAWFSMMMQRLAPGVGALGALEVVDVGYGATTLRATSGIAIRIPHTERQAARQQALSSPLRRLARILPVAIPEPLWSIPMGHPFDLGATGYAWIPGKPLSPPIMSPSIAEQTGAFLATLHTLDAATVETFAGKFRDREEVDADRERTMAIALSWLRDREPAATIDRLQLWWDRYREARSRATFFARPIHGDFWYGNLLVDPDQQRLTGVIDWENVSIDDPAQDLATLRHATDAFLTHTVRAYTAHGGTIDDDILSRAQWHWEFREFTGIALAVEVGDEEEAIDATRKLHAGPLRHCFQEAS